MIAVVVIWQCLPSMKSRIRSRLDFALPGVSSGRLLALLPFAADKGPFGIVTATFDRPGRLELRWDTKRS